MTDSAQQLQRELQEVEAQIVSLRGSTDALREQLGTDGPTDSEDIAATLTGIEENEGILNGLEQRRDSLRSQLAEAGD